MIQKSPMGCACYSKKRFAGGTALCRAFDAINAITVDQHAAINFYPFTGDETGLVRSQEDGGCRDLVRQAVAAE